MSESLSQPIPASFDPARRKILWIEVGVVFALFIFPELWVAFESHFYHSFGGLGLSWIAQGSQLLAAAAVVVPVLFIAWGSGDGFKHFGLRRVLWWRLLPIALFGLLGSLVLHSVMNHMIFPDRHAIGSGFRLAYLPHRLIPLLIAQAILYFLDAFEEEFVMRGYLMARLTELLGNRWMPLLISSALFASYHIYRGIWAVVEVFFAGIFYGVIVMLTRSVWPSTIAHALYNTTILFFFLP